MRCKEYAADKCSNGPNVRSTYGKPLHQRRFMLEAMRVRLVRSRFCLCYTRFLKYSFSADIRRSLYRLVFGRGWKESRSQLQIQTEVFVRRSRIQSRFRPRCRKAESNGQRLRQFPESPVLCQREPSCRGHRLSKHHVLGVESARFCARFFLPQRAIADSTLKIRPFACAKGVSLGEKCLHSKVSRGPRGLNPKGPKAGRAVVQCQTGSRCTDVQERRREFLPGRRPGSRTRRPESWHLVTTAQRLQYDCWNTCPSLALRGFC